MKKEVNATIETGYTYKIGHDGFTSGCGYDGGDVWCESFHAATIEKMAELLSKSKDYVLTWANYRNLYTSEIIEVEGRVFNRQIEPSNDLDGELKKLSELLKTEPYSSNMQRIKDVNERRKRILEVRRLRLKTEDERKKYEELKQKFESNQPT